MDIVTFATNGNRHIYDMLFKIKGVKDSVKAYGPAYAKLYARVEEVFGGKWVTMNGTLVIKSDCLPSDINWTETDSFSSRQFRFVCLVKSRAKGFGEQVSLPAHHRLIRQRPGRCLPEVC